MLSKSLILESISLSYQAQKDGSDLKDGHKLNVDNLEISLPPIENDNSTRRDFYKSLLDAQLIFVGGYARSGEN